jgi:chaperonin GroEL (HSP60 family)
VHSQPAEEGNNTNNRQLFGVDLSCGRVSNMMELGVIEPSVIKTEVLKHATESVNSILRIQDTLHQM